MVGVLALFGGVHGARLAEQNKGSGVRDSNKHTLPKGQRTHQTMSFFELSGGSTRGLKEGMKIRLDEEREICHVVGSSQDRRKCWKKFWTSNSGRGWPTKCQMYGCGEEATVGAHVYIKGCTGNKFYYILPTCQACNMDSTSAWGRGTAWSSAKKDAVVVATLIPSGVLNEE
ncbi:hypothetical protein QOT17_013634 [Balamuthia mandrillaris]